MNLNGFVTERTPVWAALEAELERANGRPDRLGVDGALELGRNYRATAADLALARRRFPGDPIIARLERLVLAGRQAIYSERRRGGSARTFFTRDYWRLVVGRPGILAVALLAMFGPCLIAAIWALHDPGAAIGLVPSAFKAAAHPHVHHLDLDAGSQAAFAGGIFTHNIEVIFVVFAGGLTLGLVTLVMLAYNGILVGVLAGITIQSGSFPVFVRYVVPHGLLELSCISVAGAAGLRLGWAMIDAGTLPRGASLRAQARPAVLLVLGTTPFLVLAGLTEGFVTPRGLPLGAALAVGLAWGVSYWLLVLTRGRGARRSAGTVTDGREISP
jgi:uncharacterized membrane protein SpoIIM required for sporulation